MTKKEAQKVADKITPIFELILDLTDRDIEILRETKKGIREEVSKLSAVAGILVDLNKSDDWRIECSSKDCKYRDVEGVVLGEEINKVLKWDCLK